MIIVMKANAVKEDIDTLVKYLKSCCYTLNISKSTDRTLIGAVGDKSFLQDGHMLTFKGVEEIIPISKPYKLVSREFKNNDTIININGIEIGGNSLAIMSGPCSVESLEQAKIIAEKTSKCGAKILRGGAYKPRTSPYSFQGIGPEGLIFLRKAADEYGMLVVTELTDPRDIEIVSEYADILQIGTRNMQNFRLLQEVGKQKKPVLLKRGLSATIEEFLLAAEHIAKEGNLNIILCERGIRTFETFTRNTLDLSCVPVIKNVSHLPIIVDPSHGTGRIECIGPMALAAVAAGADGLMIEVHPCPDKALSDGKQSLTPNQFCEIIDKVKAVANVVGKSIE